ncbi:MAG: M20/M25/M40 family metallo-hydrolase [Planctomycetes bacterium]|nr:M20/M25/M40 family metallo-hydrolase [Planctomycetota bacterium]
MRISAAALVVAAISFVSWLSLRAVAVQPANAPGFSALRALSAARAALGEEPRPVNSAANAAAASRLKEAFAAMGLAPMEQSATVKVPGRGEATIRNIFARIEGRQALPAILLVSHLDSVAVAPGGADNGMGVAVCLEAARMLAAGPKPQRPVVILITDGEEAGLLGAKLFAQNHPMANDIAAVINIDNRGGDGPAQLFETGPNDLALIRAIAPHIARPVMGSLFAEVYRRMPNGTDLSVFLERGITGINIACAGGVERYHTAADTFDAVNLASLQHEGDMATEALRGLLALPADAFPSDRAVFLDLFGRFVLVWPASLGMVLSLLAAIGVIAIGPWAARCDRRERGAGQAHPIKDIFKGSLAALLAFAGTLTVVFCISWILERAGFFGLPYAEALLSQQNPGVTPPWPMKFAAAYWPPHGMLVAIGLGTLCVPVSWFFSKVLLRSNLPWSGWSGVWGLMALLNVVVSVVAPGAGAILLPIVLSAAIAAWAGALIPGIQGKAAPLLATLVPIAVAAVIYAPLEMLCWPAVGLTMPLFRGFLSGLYAIFMLLIFMAPRSHAASGAS